jgi:YesN/AraC family two-component response regulator
MDIRNTFGRSSMMDKSRHERNGQDNHNSDDMLQKTNRDAHVDESKLLYLSFLNRENEFRHHRYDEEMLQYDYLKNGDDRAVEEGRKMFSSSLTGRLSDDDLTNTKYLFIAAITIASRYAIEGGMDEEDSYNASDLYIREMSKCSSVKEVRDLHTEMFTFYTEQVKKVKNKNVYSKPVIQCMDYIYYHLNEKISLNDLAEHVHLDSAYVSTIFSKECGTSTTQYIRNKRIEAAENMLKHSEYGYAEIGSILSFSSQSHFIKVFKEVTGYTPKEYREKFYRKGYI